MKKFLVALVLLSICKSVFAIVPYRAEDTLQTRDSNSQVINNVFSQGNGFDLSFNGNSSVVSDLLKRELGYTSMDNGDSIIIEMVSNGDCRYVFGTSPTVNGSLGSVLPTDIIKQIRVRTDDKAAFFARTANGEVNITRVK